MNEVHLDLAEDLSSLVERTSGVDPATGFVHVAHGPSAKPGDSLISISRRNPAAKKLISHLAVNGFYLYRITDEGSRFVRDHTIGKMWHRIKAGEYSINEDGLVYSFTPPVIKSGSMRILVIFSSISASIYNPGLMRYFEQNFRSAQKHIPPNTAILRIADIGGIIGAFYLNTVRNPENTARIQRLIRETANEHGVHLNNVVLYGASKGGTGALYHGLTGGFKCVAVDPVLSDEYYISRYSDSHFTTDGVFLETKQDLFRRVVANAEDSHGLARASGTNITVIYSERSPQFSTIQEIAVDRLKDRAAFFNCINPEILDHPDVSPKSLNTASMLMNMLFYDLNLSPGVRRIL
jgi:hypothetical protein